MKSVLIKVLIGIVLFSAGVTVGVPVCRMYDKANAPAEAITTSSVGAENPAGNADSGGREDELLLRVRDGNLEWYDGVRWNHAGTVKELVAADPIAQPSEEWQALAARLAETRAREQAAELAALSRDSGSLSVDEIVAARPQTTGSAVSRPTTSAAVQPTAPAPGNDDNDDNNDDNDDHDDHIEAPAPEPEPAPEPDTGDGENIEWSGDYE